MRKEGLVWMEQKSHGVKQTPTGQNALEEKKLRQSSY